MSAEHTKPIQTDLEILAQDVKVLLTAFQTKHGQCPVIEISTQRFIDVREPQLFSVTANISISGGF